MKLIFKLGCFALLALSLMGFLSSCSSNSTMYTYSAPTSPDGKACVDECEQSKSICKAHCHKADPDCLENTKERAHLEFQQYVEQQANMQAPVTKTEQFFYHPEFCAHTGCGCENEYQVCYQLCGTRSESHHAIAATGEY